MVQEARNIALQKTRRDSSIFGAQWVMHSDTALTLQPCLWTELTQPVHMLQPMTLNGNL
jgi:hypothetical protein